MLGQQLELSGAALRLGYGQRLLHLLLQRRLLLPLRRLPPRGRLALLAAIGGGCCCWWWCFPGQITSHRTFCLIHGPLVLESQNSKNALPPLPNPNPSLYTCE